LCHPQVVAPKKSTFDIQLEECRAEWRRRHPAKSTAHPR
jgi:hypothetical protein